MALSVSIFTDASMRNGSVSFLIRFGADRVGFVDRVALLMGFEVSNKNEKTENKMETTSLRPRRRLSAVDRGKRAATPFHNELVIDSHRVCVCVCVCVCGCVGVSSTCRSTV